VEGLHLSILTLDKVEQRQIVEARSHIGMVWPKGLFQNT